MRCLILGLTILLTLWSSPASAERVKFCLFICIVEADAPIDSFCENYTQVNRSADDAATIKAIKTRAVKSRVIGNDAKYLCQCKAWDNPICKQ